MELEILCNIYDIDTRTCFRKIESGDLVLNQEKNQDVKDWVDREDIIVIPELDIPILIQFLKEAYLNQVEQGN